MVIRGQLINGYSKAEDSLRSHLRTRTHESKMLIKGYIVSSFMKQVRRLPRWIVEDPSGVQDPNIGQNQFKSKEALTNITATCAVPTMTCDLFDHYMYPSFSSVHSRDPTNPEQNYRTDDPGNIRRYVASRYLNPNYNLHDRLNGRLRKFSNELDGTEISQDYL